jgi:hypothetical protein
VTRPHQPSGPNRRLGRRWGQALGVIAVAVAVAAGGAHAQTDFYNTSVGRPLRIEDASPVEYRAIEIDVAPLRFERGRGAMNHWSLHPETALGILPRTQIQIGLPLVYADATGASSLGVAGLEFSVLHALNAETSIPALAIAAELRLPVGSLAGGDTYGTFKGIMTRTLPWARFHANAQVTVGPSLRSNETQAVSAGGSDVSRWLAGVAVDKTFPLRSLLVSAEAFAERPVADDASVAWSAGTGVRYQLTPRWAFDGGLGRRLSGDDRVWYVTFGSAFALGLP